MYGEPANPAKAAELEVNWWRAHREWIRQGCHPDSSLLPLEHAALVRCYAALLAAVHR